MEIGGGKKTAQERTQNDAEMEPDPFPSDRSGGHSAHRSGNRISPLAGIPECGPEVPGLDGGGTQYGGREKLQAFLAAAGGCGALCGENLAGVRRKRDGRGALARRMRREQLSGGRASRRRGGDSDHSGGPVPDSVRDCNPARKHALYGNGAAGCAGRGGAGIQHGCGSPAADGAV